MNNSLVTKLRLILENSILQNAKQIQMFPREQFKFNYCRFRYIIKKRILTVKTSRFWKFNKIIFFIFNKILDYIFFCVFNCIWNTAFLTGAVEYAVCTPAERDDPTNKWPWCYTKLHLIGNLQSWSIPSSPLLSDLLWLGVVAPVMVSLTSRIGLFNHLFRIIIISLFDPV